ncbi:MAG: M20/M25/M40 family metallo-hydrolase [candidate division KSB1 bacterium]|nr:M20/M25/M40 family metallo-hydrolase [candidate division KSB1 bacterium]MDQ7065042.1 M20/M25/M40 family metallo-hydrolase [candidate division KSB1 bacterium]
MTVMKRRLGLWNGLLALGLLVPLMARAQTDSNAQPYLERATKLIDRALQERQAYDMLRELTLTIGPRLSGSPQAAAAVEWGRQKLVQIGADSVWLQPVMVPRWVRGEVEEAEIIQSTIVGDHPLTVCALGGSVGTPEMGVIGEVIEVHDFDELARLGKKAIAGKIVFFNRPMDPAERNTFRAYGGAVNQRTRGAAEAAKYGAVAVLVRSMTTRLDDVPHTGGMRYIAGIPKIPAAAISTLDAEFLSRLLKREDHVRVRLRLSCETLPDVPSANVIGEIRGSEKPDEIIVIGGHLDSWDKGHGAHDDGAGCVQSIEALRLLRALGLHPKRTIRAVLFMNEENGLRGGREYARVARQQGWRHVAAIESDRGGFAPRGFSVDAPPAVVEKLARWAYLFEQIEAGVIRRGGGGADISPLKRQGVPTIGLMVDSHRYFDYHHSDNDTFDKVNERELELGAAMLAILSYVLAQEGL